MLKLRRIGIDDYTVLEGEQRIGRIRLAGERTPPIWLWTINIHLTGGLPMGSSQDLETQLKARTPPEELAAAFKAMIRDGG